MEFTNGSRNIFVYQLACNLNRKGVNIQKALGFILTDFGYDEKEVTQAVNRAYGNLQEFGKNKKPDDPKKSKKAGNLSIKDTTDSEEEDEDKSKLTQIERLELFLSTRYVFRHNTVTGKIEFKYFGKKMDCNE